MFLSSKKGFTLIELMVSVSIFSVVMVMAMGSIISVLDANRKSSSIRSIMDDMNYTLDGMSRTIRFATDYRCSVDGSGADFSPQDCPGNTALTVAVLNPADGTTSHVIYLKDGTSIKKTVVSSAGDSSSYTLTSPDVTVQNLTFWVRGSNPADALQPEVIIAIKGVAGQNNSQTSFNLQTTVSERKLDLLP